MKGYKKRPECKHSNLLGGQKRIRTAVRGFADLCLATRPPDHLLERKYMI